MCWWKSGDPALEIREAWQSRHGDRIQAACVRHGGWFVSWPSAAVPSETIWPSFLRHLKQRALKGAKLFVSDKCLGLVEVFGESYPEAPWQRCVVHWYRNVLTVVLGRSDELSPADLGLPGHQATEGRGPQLISLREAEKRHIEYVVRRVGGNKSRACQILGIGRGTLYRKL